MTEIKAIRDYETVEKLLNHMPRSSGYDLPYDEIREDQLKALNERFSQQVETIKLVNFRAEDAGVTEIGSLEEVVPLLLPHTAYKSYPESVLVHKKWDRLTKWLGSVSTASLANVNLEGVTDIDEWVARLAEHGHLISCTSGTTGNPALMLSTHGDAEFAKVDLVNAMLWGSGIQPAQDRWMFSFAMITQTPRGRAMSGGLFDAVNNPAREPFVFPAPPVNIGSVTKMIALRKAIAEGTAKPGEIADFEAESEERQKSIEAAISKSAEAVIAAREEKLHISGMWGVLFPVAEEVRKRGYSAKDFHPENSISLAGGLKRAQVPDNYEEIVFDTFNLSKPRIYKFYSMQEMQSCMPACQEGGRYHIPPWLVCLPLDEAGEKLQPGVGQGTVEGRAAFFDLSLEGRWGGIISGDHISIDYGPCACGSRSPSISDNIYRYADLKGDDKIACSGTVDAYVRGIS